MLIYLKQKKGTKNELMKKKIEQYIRTHKFLRRNYVYHIADLGIVHH